MSGNDAGRISEALGELTSTVERSGLIDPGSRGVALLSGGPDSVAMLAGLAGFLKSSPPLALHINYGLREEADADQATAAEVCELLGIELVVRQAGRPEGNLQAWARELRYGLAEELRVERGSDWIAAGHTRTDVAETVIYRLAASPGRRALAAMKPRNGRIVRPMLELERHETRGLANAAGLPVAFDRTNDDPTFARVRIRSEVLPLLREVNPGAISNIAATRSELLEEGDLLEALAGTVLESAGLPDGGLSVAGLGDSHPAMWRLVIRHLAERELGRTVSFSIAQTELVRRLAGSPEGGSVDLGGGASLTIEAGTLAVETGRTDAPEEEAVVLNVPGMVEWSGLRISTEIIDPPEIPGDGMVATLDLDAIGQSLTIRGWQAGDRIQPLGMDGSKNLQDLFTDSSVPRSRRRQIPLVLSGDRIIWVAGMTVAHPFRLRPDTRSAVRITATPARSA
ncbi:MAG: tRNA lysidine(34) synthetase TilS [Solirubrobacterales bacterium]